MNPKASWHALRAFMMQGPMLPPLLVALDWTVLGAVNVAGGVAMALFGLLVAAVPPRSRVQAGFGLFAVAWGCTTVVVNLSLMMRPEDPLLGVMSWLGVVLTLAGTLGLAALWMHMPLRLQREERRLLVPAVAVVLPFLAWSVIGLVRIESFAHLGAAAHTIAWIPTLWGVWAGLLILLVLRFLHKGATPSVLRQVPILSAGLALYLAVNVRWLLPGHPDAMRIHGLLLVVFMLVLSALWLVAAARFPERRAPRNVAWIVLAVALVGLLHDAFFAAMLQEIGIDGIARLATVVVLTVAILRFEALGVHRKLRFGISRSAVAAAFVATFFISSEAAKHLFSEFAGNELIGIAAAGVLVFAIAPLQRLGDRFAAKAVPVESRPGATGDAEESYRSALRWALRDGVLDRSEEVRLLVLAEDLGIKARRALALRQQVEAELAAA